MIEIPRHMSPTARDAICTFRRAQELIRRYGEPVGAIDPLGSQAAYIKMIRAIVADAVPRAMRCVARGRVGAYQ